MALVVGNGPAPDEEFLNLNIYSAVKQRKSSLEEDRVGTQEEVLLRQMEEQRVTGLSHLIVGYLPKLQGPLSNARPSPLLVASAYTLH